MTQAQKTGAEQAALKRRPITVETIQGKNLALTCQEPERAERRPARCVCTGIPETIRLIEAQTVSGLWRNT